jgi:hypothetical protein
LPAEFSLTPREQHPLKPKRQREIRRSEAAYIVRYFQLSTLKVFPHIMMKKDRHRYVEQAV